MMGKKWKRSRGKAKRCSFRLLISLGIRRKRSELLTEGNVFNIFL